MRQVPDCLHRRYRAVDELIKELSTSMSHQSEEGAPDRVDTNKLGIKLMCNFWNILKENPDCDLTKAVREKMGLMGGTSVSGNIYRPRIACYMATHNCSKKDGSTQRGPMDKTKSPPVKNVNERERSACCSSKSSLASNESNVLPLNKVLCSLKEVASFDRKCNAKIASLMETEKELQDQIQHLEHREKEGIEMLKQADCMWSCMEDAYKKKIAETLGRQDMLLKQLNEVEASATKWRKIKKDLESQMDHLNKCQQEITEKCNQKTIDLKSMEAEISDYKKRIESNKKETEAAKKSLTLKKEASDKKVAGLTAEMAKLGKVLAEEKQYKLNKEREGASYVKNAREDLQKISKVLLQKKIENEDLMAESEALLQELNLLKQTCDQCKAKCTNKQQSINDEIKKIDKEIADSRVKCIRCHQCTDTVDVRKFCTDCPRCAQERDCIYEQDHCDPDRSLDCVCLSVKQKFLDNVFDNMYTVLEGQIKTPAGKGIADAVMDCLKRSRNGKLDEGTRKMLQEFILSTVKKNLDLTIVGGAIKTRCEMDSETYNQLMLCLKQVKAVRPPKVDKGTVAKKESCSRWGGTNECNCPKGPKDCVCTKRAPPPPNGPSPCPQSNKIVTDEVMVCPHKEATTCGPDCAMHAGPSAVETDIASWRPDPCKAQNCIFSKNMRAAQCVLGPEALFSASEVQISRVPRVSDVLNLDDHTICNCGKSPIKTCVCPKDVRSTPRERIIEEVMGLYTDATPLEKMDFTFIINDSTVKY